MISPVASHVRSEHAAVAAGVTAVVLCGGRGERLRPMTDTVPKPLLPVNGQPLLEYLLQHLSDHGVRDILLCIGYMAERFEQYVNARTPGPERVRCVNSGDAGMTERIAAARPLIGDRALVCYGDTPADVQIGELISTHRKAQAEATITVHPYRSPFGIVTFDEAGFVSRFEEKLQLPYWVNIGFLVLEPTAMRGLCPEAPLPECLRALAARRKLAVHCHLGRHWTANTESELRELAAEWAR